MNLIKRFLKNNELILSVALFLSLTVGFFGPSHVYITNQLEFRYMYRDILFLLLAISILLFLLLSMFLGLVKNNRLIGEKTTILIFGIGFLSWFQSNFLIREIGVFDGKLIDWTTMNKYINLDNFIWIFILSLLLTLSKILIQKIKFISLFIIVFQLIYFIYMCISNNTDLSLLKYRVDFSNKFVFSKKKNVIVLLLDATQSDIFYKVLHEEKRYPEIFSGFKYFTDTVGGFPTTYPSVPLILTGEYYKNEEPIQNFLKDKYLDTSILKKLRDNSFSTEVYSESSTIYYNEDIISNIYPVNWCIWCNSYFKYLPNLYDVSFFRMVPTSVKKYVYNEGSFLLSDLKTKRSIKVNDNIISQNGDIKFINDFVNNGKAVEKEPIFKYIYLNGSHAPYNITRNLEVVAKRNDTEAYKEQIRGMMTLLDNFIKKLKSINAFDNSMIVILADHGAGIDDFSESNCTETNHIYSNFTSNEMRKFAFPLLLIKPFDNNAKLEIDTTQASLEDVSKTILDSLGIKSEGYTGINLLSDNSNLDRERNFYYYKWINDRWNTYYLPEMRQYKVYGNGCDPESWKDTFISYSDEGVKYDAPNTYEIGNVINFGLDGNAESYQMGGWNFPGKDKNWTDSKISSLRLDLFELPNRELKLKVKFMPLFPQKVLLYVDSEYIGEWYASDLKEYEMLIPKEIIKKKDFSINFVMPEATKSPRDLGISEDMKKFGIAVYSLELN